MDLLRFKSKMRGGLCGVVMKGDDGGGGAQTTTTGATTTTNNTDQRQAVQDGIASNGTGNTVNYSSNSSDAVVAIANAGSDIIKSSGGAVVKLAELQTAANTAAWDSTITNGSKLIDHLINQVGDGFKLSEKVVSSFQPNENKQAQTMQYGLIAAAVVAAAVLLKGSK